MNIFFLRSSGIESKFLNSFNS